MMSNAGASGWLHFLNILAFQERCSVPFVVRTENLNRICYGRWAPSRSQGLLIMGVSSQYSAVAPIHVFHFYTWYSASPSIPYQASYPVPTSPLEGQYLLLVRERRDVFQHRRAEWLMGTPSPYAGRRSRIATLDPDSRAITP